MKTETATVMIVDLAGSTAVIAGISRSRMDQLMLDAAGPIRRIVEAAGGNVVKFTGDGYLITFRSASDALLSARRIVQQFASQPVLPIGERFPGCRVAMHTCDVVLFEGDVLGEGVVIPVRIEKRVPEGCIYVTATVREVAKSAEFEFEFVGELALKGIPYPVSTYRLLTDRYGGVERSISLTVTDLVGMSQRLTHVELRTVRDELRQVRRRLDRLEQRGEPDGRGGS